VSQRGGWDVGVWRLNSGVSYGLCSSRRGRDCMAVDEQREVHARETREPRLGFEQHEEAAARGCTAPSRRAEAACWVASWGQVKNQARATLVVSHLPRDVVVTGTIALT
jgi:hypothetical protein